MTNLAFQKARPLTRNLSLKDISTSKIMNLIPAYVSVHGTTQPEVSALKFYVQNHAWGLAQLKFNDHEPLGAWESIVAGYHQAQHSEVIRMFYYLILICTRESRHMNGGPKKTALFKKFSNIQEFHGSYVNDTSSFTKIEYMCANSPSVPFGEYTDFLVEAFECGYSGGYGGKPWKIVAECLREFAHGRITAEMMMDTAFTLAHNNGPIFNKGMLYNHYNYSEIMKILDTQASGQIPQLIAGKESSYVSDDVYNIWKDAYLIIGDEFGGSVDWLAVTNCSKGGHSYKGHSSTAPYIDKAAELSLADKVALKAKEKSYLEIHENVWIKKLSRKEAKVS